MFIFISFNNNVRRKYTHNYIIHSQLVNTENLNIYFHLNKFQHQFKQAYNSHCFKLSTTERVNLSLISQITISLLFNKIKYIAFNDRPHNFVKHDKTKNINPLFTIVNVKLTK